MKTKDEKRYNLYAISFTGEKNSWTKQFLTEKDVINTIKQGFIVKKTNYFKED